jgi:DNA helicase-2/ATP-dependent DNA helicase PcrA
MSGPSSISSLLTGLDPEQTEAVSAPPSPLVVVAGAGSGKTTVLTRRVAFQILRGDAPVSGVLAVTHTTRAASEIKERLQSIDPLFAGASCSTVHAAAWRVLKKFHKEAGFDTLPSLASSTLPLVKQSMSRSGLSTHDLGEVLDVVNELEWAAVQGLAPESYIPAASSARRNPGFSLEKLAATFEAYRTIKTESNVVDFADLLSSSSALLLNNESVAQRVRSVWSLIVVDEFQDTDPAQAKFLYAVRGSSPLWTVVGDPRQTIYSFKGADPSLLRNEMRAKGTKVVYLSNSWRCSKEILSWANKTVGPTYGPPLRSTSSGPLPVFVDVPNEELEADSLVSTLKSWRSSNVEFRDMAVLTRFNSSTARLEAVLAAEDIPYQVLGGPKFLERPEVLDVLRKFGAAARRDPEEDGVDLLRQSAFDLGYDLESPPDSRGVVRARWESVRALVDLASSFQDLSAGGVLEEFLELNRTEASVGVSIGTIHSAKGLEWTAVYVVGAQEGNLPSVHAVSPAEIEEERRLFYVALTRAKKFLTVCYARSFKKMPQYPSRFLFSLPNVSIKSSKKSSKGSSKSSFSKYPKNSSPTFPTSGSHKGSYKSSRTSNSSKDESSSDDDLELTLPSGAQSNYSFLGECEKCGRRLTGAPARIAKRCSGACLDGDLGLKYNRLVAWRLSLTPSNATPSSVVSDRLLFKYVVTNSLPDLWPKGLTPPE